LATSRHWHVHQLDVKKAFLWGDLSEMDYMHQPLGQGSGTAYLLLYVDDIVLTASSEVLEFSMTDHASLNYFLGISVTCNSLGMFLSERKYVAEILERAHMVNCNPIRTPVDTESKLGDDGDPGASFTQGTISSIPIGGSISPEGFLLPILQLVVIIVTVVIVIVIMIVVVDDVKRVPAGPVFLLGLLELAIYAACAFRAEEMPSLISCWMAAKVMAGVSDMDVFLGGILSTEDNT
ncbi:ribonuclease H-like domain-containing protein, partial [Tanacetum coccineum]